MNLFSEQEYLRYTRHIQLPGAGAAGQSKLKQAHVLIVGCGGLGAPVSYYLAAAGVGTITLVDNDTVDLSNLQRQITFTEADIGKSKALCTKLRLEQLNSDINIHAVDKALSLDNAAELIQAADLVLDCTDNFATRYLINDLCKVLGKRWIYASIYQFSGQCALFNPDQSCFRCIFPSAPSGDSAPNCNTAGVLGVLPGLLGTMQASEALKLLLGLPSAISNTLMLVETDSMQFQKIALQQKSTCPCCSTEFRFNPDCADYSGICATERISENANESASNTSVICAADFQQYHSRDDIVVVDVRNKAEHHAFNLGGLNIPLDELATPSEDINLAGNLDKNKTLLLYCQSGIRSQQACHLLSAKNYKAISVEGGIVKILRHRLDK